MSSRRERVNTAEVLTFGNVRKVVRIFVALHVAREPYASLESGIQYVRFVQQQDELNRREEFARANRLPEIKRV